MKSPSLRTDTSPIPLHFLGCLLLEPLTLESLVQGYVGLFADAYVAGLGAENVGFPLAIKDYSIYSCHKELQKIYIHLWQLQYILVGDVLYHRFMAAIVLFITINGWNKASPTMVLGDFWHGWHWVNHMMCVWNVVPLRAAMTLPFLDKPTSDTHCVFGWYSWWIHINIICIYR